jgi:hypothetical protein
LRVDQHVTSGILLFARGYLWLAFVAGGFVIKRPKQEGLGSVVWSHSYQSQGRVGDLLQLLPQRDPGQRPQLQQIVSALNDLDLWKDTVVIFTADHGEMTGAHGGIKREGPLCYEANADVPLIIAHPKGKPGSTTSALTSHLDLLPMSFGLTGLSESSRPQTLRALPGHDFSPLR